MCIGGIGTLLSGRWAVSTFGRTSGWFGVGAVFGRGGGSCWGVFLRSGRAETKVLKPKEMRLLKVSGRTISGEVGLLVGFESAMFSGIGLPVVLAMRR